LRVSESIVLRRIFGPKREEEARGWRRLHNEELRKWYVSPNSICVIKSRGKRWVRHVAQMGKMRNACKIVRENLTRRDHSEDLSGDEKVILQWMLGK